MRDRLNLLILFTLLAAARAIIVRSGVSTISLSGVNLASDDTNYSYAIEYGGACQQIPDWLAHQKNKCGFGPLSEPAWEECGEPQCMMTWHTNTSCSDLGFCELRGHGKCPKNQDHLQFVSGGCPLRKDLQFSFSTAGARGDDCKTVSQDWCLEAVQTLLQDVRCLTKGFWSNRPAGCSMNVAEWKAYYNTAGVRNARNKDHYSLCVGTDPKDKVHTLPQKPDLPVPPKVVNPVGHCDHKYPRGILHSNATDCDEAVLGGVGTCDALRNKGVKCDGCGLCPLKDVYWKDDAVANISGKWGGGGKYRCPDGKTYFVGATKMAECGDPTQPCIEVGGIGGESIDGCSQAGNPYAGMRVICGPANDGCVSDPKWFWVVPSQNCEWFARYQAFVTPAHPKGDCRNDGANKHCCACGGGTYPGIAV